MNGYTITAAAARRAAVIFLLAPLAMGCSLPGQKLAACKAEKEQLLAGIQQKQNRLMVLEAEKRQTDQRLAQAEKSLALLHDNRADIQRLASRPDSPGSRGRATLPISQTYVPSDPVTEPANSNSNWSQRSLKQEE